MPHKRPSPPLIGAAVMALALALPQSLYADEDKDFLVRPFMRAGWFQASLEADEEEIEFVPNPMMNAGIKIGYKKLTASFSFGFTRFEEVEDYGESTNFDVELAYPLKVFERELVATGFLHAHENLSTPGPYGGRIMIEGMDAIDAGIDLILFLDRRFSFEGCLQEIKPRTGNAGSPLVRTSAGVMYIGFIEEAADRVFIPFEGAASVGDLADLHLLRDAYASLAGGYAFDWNLRKALFLTMVGSLGMTVSRLDLSYAGGDSRNAWTLGPSVSTLVGFSYAGPSFHAGTSVNVGMEGAQIGEETLISGLRTSVFIFAGARF